MHYLNESNILLFLVQIFILLGLSRVFGEILKKFGQPSLTGEMIVGLILGPTILGRFLPEVFHKVFPNNAIQQTMLDSVAWLGIMFFLLKTGLEMDFSSAWRQKGEALVISISDVIIPMIVSFLPAFFFASYYFPEQKIIFALFISTVMTISALPVTARVLIDLNLYKTDLGFLIMCALSVNDILGWILFTLILGFFTHAELRVIDAVSVILFTVGFTFFSLTIGRQFSNYVISKIKTKGISEPAGSLTFISLLGILCGSITAKIGIHPLFGFFIAGMMAGEAKALSERTRLIISQMVDALFVPLFFATIGLKIDFLKNFDPLLSFTLIVIGIAGRFLGAWIGVALSKKSHQNKTLISIAHTPGGEMQIVVGILALECKLISEPVFVAIVFGAVLSSIIMGPWMAYAIKRRKEVSVLEFFSKRAVIEDMQTDKRDTAIEELCELAAHQENTPQFEAIYEAVLKRENEMGTSIGSSIAVPHARIDGIKTPIIVFGKSKTGVDWDSPDGKPSNFIFLILTPKNDETFQIGILRAIAIVMNSDENQKKLINADGQPKIWDLIQEMFASHSIKN